MPAIKNLNYKMKILLIGMAYKPNVNDCRESPSIEIYKKLKKFNNIVNFFDSKIRFIKINKKIIKSQNTESFKNYDAIVLCTNHDDLNKKKLIKDAKLIFDTRGVFKNLNLKKIIHL